MGHVVFVLAVVFIGLAWWRAVYLAPPSLSLLLRRNRVVSFLGLGAFAAGLASAGATPYGSGNPAEFIWSLQMAFWGGWLMLAPTAADRSSPDDADLMQRLAIMLMALMAVLVLSFGAPDRVVAGLQLWLVLFGASVVLFGATSGRRSSRP